MKSLVFDQRSALDTIDDLVARLSTGSSLCDNYSILLLVPDFITANQLRDYLTSSEKSLMLSKLLVLTIEELAEKIIGNSPVIIDPELARLVLVSAIQQLDDPIAEKLRETFGNLENPEDSALVETLLKELDEYCTMISPRYRDQEKVEEDLDKIIETLQPLLRDQATEVLTFYRLLVQQAEMVLKQMESEVEIYLTRAHLVSESCRALESTPLETFVNSEKVDEVCIIGIPLFDETVLDFLSILFRNRSRATINVSEEITRRLKSRLANRLGEKFQAQEVIPPIDHDPQIAAFKIPDKRREIELAALTCLDLLSEGVSPSDILITSRLASDYESYFDSVFREYGLPTFMQTRVSLLFTPSYRLIESALTLLIRFEKDQPISATEISTLLRLGFPITYRWRDNTPRRKSQVTDRRFLGIETELERIQRYHGKRKLEEWLTYLRDRKATVSERMGFYIYEPVIQILTWVQKFGTKKPSFDPLIKLLNSFIAIYGIQREFPTMGIIPTARFDLTKEHITSEATRVLQNLYYLIDKQKQFAQARSILESEEKEATWSDAKKAYVGNIGNTTYGKIYRDSDSILFVDAGLSHLLDAKHRIILGITSGQFPREAPKPFLIFPELRDAINHPNHGYFLTNSETQYEVEKYLYSAARGRATTVTVSMNYLDERGHSQHPSVFFPACKSQRVSPHELRVELSQTFHRTTTHNLSSLLFHKIYHNQNKNLKELESEIASIFHGHKLEKHVENEITAINTTLRALLERVVHRKFRLELENDLEDVLKEVFVHGRVPNSWEVDLVTYCPVMYYFYVFYYLLPNKNWVEKNHASPMCRYVPGWKKDFRIGRLPIPVWRTQFSTVGSEWLEEKLDGKTALTEKDKADLEEEIEELEVSIAEKSSFKYLLSYLSELNTFTFKPRQESNSQGIIRPISLFFDNKHFVLYKLAPREPYNFTHLFNQYYEYAISPWAPERKYQPFEEHDLSQAKSFVVSTKAFSNFIEQKISNGRNYPIDIKLCEECVYRTLCGEWGF